VADVYPGMPLLYSSIMFLCSVASRRNATSYYMPQAHPAECAQVLPAAQHNDACSQTRSCGAQPVYTRGIAAGNIPPQDWLAAPSRGVVQSKRETRMKLISTLCALHGLQPVARRTLSQKLLRMVSVDLSSVRSAAPCGRAFTTVLPQRPCRLSARCNMHDH
jgi:hypothetical protein